MARRKLQTSFPGVNWMGREEERAARDVLRKGALFRYYGPEKPSYAALLEEKARAFYGKKHALALNSGTGALMTALQAMGVGPGDEVVVPAFFWVSTVGAVVQSNAIPVLCEIDDSFTMAPADLEKKITPRTKVIVPVHMAGAPCDMKRIMEIADRRGVAVLEDCAQCNGGSFEGRKVGTFGRVGMFSLQINKNITCGEGGLLVTDEEDLFLRMCAVHDVGLPWVGPSPRTDLGVQAWGQGRRMSELTAAVACAQMDKLARIVEHTRKSNRRIERALRVRGAKGLAFRRSADPAGQTGSFLVLLFPDAAAAVDAVRRLNEAGQGGLWRIADYGMHVYCNVPQLVNKASLSAAGNPWSLPQNANLAREYGRGACPRSDDLFDRAVLVTVPSRLTRVEEKEMIARMQSVLGVCQT
jgi:8-amino-3,8-dideoxy-alpha-D-manno-octulosonate transaminase